MPHQTPEGRHEQFTAFARARTAALRRTAFLLCGDWHRAEDIVQTAMIRLYVAWHRASRADSVEAYARQAVLRVFLDQRRRFWHREVPAHTMPDTGYSVADTDDRVVLLAALAKVPDRQRAAIVLRYWDDLSVSDVAAALDCSQGTVKSQTARGLATLRAHLESAGYRGPGIPAPVPPAKEASRD